MISDNCGVVFDEKKIDEIFAELNQVHLPGAAVGIAVEGIPVYRKGFGLANMDLPVILSPAMRMRIYSTTKHFTCLAFLLLCEEGKATIDDPIGKYLPEIHAIGRAVTIRQLMGNVSGLLDACDIRWQLSGTEHSVSSDELVSFYREIDVRNFAPGTAWCYNNGGFQLLSTAIERISGRSLEDELRERIFDQVGMRNSLLRRFDNNFLSNSATMHMTTSSGGYDRSYLAGSLAGEGGIVSTVDDMLQWLSHMESPVVGSTATWETMRTPQRLSNGTSTGYGLGLMIDEYRGLQTLAHPGGGLGANSQMLKIPLARLDVVVLVNRHDISSTSLTNKIIDSCLPDLPQLPELAKHSAAVGVFRSQASGQIIHLHAKGGQQIVSVNGTDFPFVAKGKNMLVPSPEFGFTKLTINLVGNRGMPTAIRVSDFGNPDYLELVERSPISDIAAIAGIYLSKATHSGIEIVSTSDGPRLIASGRFGRTKFKLECLANGIWKFQSTTPAPWGGVLGFNENGDSFQFLTARTRGLHFQRVT